MSNSNASQSMAATGSETNGASLETGAADTLHRILRLSNKLAAPFSTYLAHRYDITLNEFRLLMLIGLHPHSASHEVAEMTGVTPMSVSRAVAALRKQGRLQVGPDPRNRRRKSLVLTEEGQRLYEMMRPQADLVANYLVSALAPHEIATLNHFLDTLVNTLEAKDEDGQSLFLESTRPPET